MRRLIKVIAIFMLAACSSVAPPTSDKTLVPAQTNVETGSSPLQEAPTQSNAISVWQDINSRYTPEQVFQKIMALANQAWVTPQEVEKTFGIKFKPPSWDKGVGYVYVAEGREAFEMFYDEKKRGWTLMLYGPSISQSKDSCIGVADARKAVIAMGWEEQIDRGHPVDRYTYIRKTDKVYSMLSLSNIEKLRENACLSGIQFTNALSSKKNN